MTRERLDWVALRIVRASRVMSHELTMMTETLNNAGVATHRVDTKTRTGIVLSRIFVKREDYDRAYDTARLWLPPKPRGADV